MGQEFFSAIDNLFLKKKEIDLKEIGPMCWQINRYLSMDKDLLLPVNLFNRYLFTLKERYYILLDRFIPKMLGKPRITYYKKPVIEEACSRVARMYNVSTKEASQYLELFKVQMGDEVYNWLGVEKSVLNEK
jgi:hypothetical protein